jgi:hypothetical protein
VNPTPRGDNHTASNPGDVLVYLVHLGLGTLLVSLSTRVLCVSLLFDASPFCHGVCIGRSRLPLFFLLFFFIPPSLDSCHFAMVFELRDNEACLALSFSILIILHDARIEGHKLWYLLRMS